MPTICQDQHCNEHAAVCITWRTPTMSASAYWYVCATHAPEYIKGLAEAVKDTRWLPVKVAR